MGIPYRRRIAAIVLTLFVLTTYSTRSLGQEAERVGSVLEKRGRTQYWDKGAKKWQPLDVDQLIFNQDQVLTQAASKVSVHLKRFLLIQDVGERTRAHFLVGESKCKEFEEGEGLKQPAPVPITQVDKGRVWVDSRGPAEMHTPNAVVCVQGTTVLIHFTTPPDTTEVISLVGTVTVWSRQGVRDKVTLEANSRALVIGDKKPVKNPDLPFPDAPRQEVLAPEVGSNPQTDAITSSTSPAAVEFIRNSALGVTLLIPR